MCLLAEFDNASNWSVLARLLATPSATTAWRGAHCLNDSDVPAAPAPRGNRPWGDPRLPSRQRTLRYALGPASPRAREPRPTSASRSGVAASVADPSAGVASGQAAPHAAADGSPLTAPHEVLESQSHEPVTGPGFAATNCSGPHRPHRRVLFHLPADPFQRNYRLGLEADVLRQSGPVPSLRVAHCLTALTGC